MRCQAFKLLAFISELRGRFCCRPTSIVETPKTSLRSGIDVQMDVVRVSRLVVVKESDSVPIGEKLSREMEVKSNGMEETMDGRLEIKARPWGMMRKAKLRWPRRDRS